MQGQVLGQPLWCLHLLHPRPQRHSERPRLFMRWTRHLCLALSLLLQPRLHWNFLPHLPLWLAL